jgi:saccharopine dehydrogenase-like NADP-dependent oxidoreductase
MKVIVVGAAGAMAAVAIKDLLEFGEDVWITAADSRPLWSDDPSIRPVPVDVRDIDSTTKLVEGHDVLVNCVTYYLNVDVMRAALQARVPYTDLGGLYHGSRKQFELHEEFERAGVTAVLGMGSTPGITNVMAGALAQRMDSVSEIHVRVACHDEAASGPLQIPYALDTILDEFALEPMVYSEGQAKAVPPMSGSELIDFPQPVGKAEAVYSLHSEVAMFPRSFPGLREAGFKVAFPRDFTQKIRFLVELGFASRDKIVGNVSPREMLLAVIGRQSTIDTEPRDCDVLRVLVKGIKEGKPVTATAESVIFPHAKWKISAGALDTGVPLSIVAQMLAQGVIRTPGVLCPETSVPPDFFFQELARRGITVSLAVTS